MDTIDVTNLNRQFLFRAEDMGKSKAETAATRVRERVRGCAVNAHHGRIEDKEDGWYKQFDIIALGIGFSGSAGVHQRGVLWVLGVRRGWERGSGDD